MSMEMYNRSKVRYQNAKDNVNLYLLGLVEESGFVFERIDELKLLAATITSWEEKARYSTGIKTKEHTIYRVLNIYDEIEKAFLALL